MLFQETSQNLNLCSWGQINDSHLHTCQIKVFESQHKLPLKILEEWSLKYLNQDGKISISVAITEALHHLRKT